MVWFGEGRIFACSAPIAVLYDDGKLCVAWLGVDIRRCNSSGNECRINRKASLEYEMQEPVGDVNFFEFDMGWSAEGRFYSFQCSNFCDFLVISFFESAELFL